MLNQEAWFGLSKSQLNNRGNCNNTTYLFPLLIMALKPYNRHSPFQQVSTSFLKHYQKKVGIPITLLSNMDIPITLLKFIITLFSKFLPQRQNLYDKSGTVFYIYIKVASEVL